MPPPPSYSASPVVSRAPSRCLPYPRPLERPEEYPVSILWTLEACKNDPTVNVSDTNRSRPSMQRSIRYENGKIISESDWKSLREAAIHIARTHLMSLDSSDRNGQR